MARLFALALIALAALLPGRAGAAGTMPPDNAAPMAVVQGFYRADAHDYEPYSRRLRALFKAAVDNSHARDIPVAGLDFDFVVNGQDNEPDTYRSARFTLVSQAGNRAEVKVTFRNGGAQELRYTLVLEGGRWLMDDVRSVAGERWLWSEMLIRGAREK